MKNTSYLSCHNELVMAAFREKRCAMNLQTLKYIIEIEKYGSISRAAENLHLSQPYLSKIVKEMENEFQISLFTRSKRGITLTESGRLFINMGKDLQRNIDNFQSMFHSHLEYEQLRISSRTCSHPFDAFVRMLQEMEGKKLRCVFRETTNDQVISDIYTNAADVGVLLLDRGNWKDVARILEIKRIACRRLCSSRGYLLARSGHPLLRLGQPVQGADIYRYNFVLYESQSWSNYNLVGDTHLSETAELLDWDRVQQVVYVTSRAALHDVLPCISQLRASGRAGPGGQYGIGHLPDSRGSDRGPARKRQFLLLHLPEKPRAVPHLQAVHSVPEKVLRVPL